LQLLFKKTNQYCHHWKANQVDGKKKKGRPRLRWMDNVELDLRHMGLKRCRTRALDRRECVFVMKEALRGL
jgi:hypothetical protein